MQPRVKAECGAARIPWVLLGKLCVSPQGGSASRVRGEPSAGEAVPLWGGNGPRICWDPFAYRVWGRTLELVSQGHGKWCQAAFPSKELIVV